MTDLPPVVNGDSSMANSNRSSQVYGQTDTMKLLSGTKEGYLAFPIPTSLEPGDTITATVHVPQIGSWNGTRDLTLRAVQRWTTGGRNALTWDNRPAVYAGSSDHTVTVVNTSDGAEAVWTVSADVQAAVAAGDRKVRFRLRTTDAFARDVSGIPGAYLAISYARADGAPTDLNPGDGQVISVAKPVLTFSAPDVQAIQVQAAAVGAAFTATGGFTGPLFDSGQLSQAFPQLDVSSTSWAGWSEAQALQWTARFKNSSGVWSPYAPPVTVTKTALPADATINNPVAQVWEKSPPLIGSMTGLTQVQWLVYDLSKSASVPVYDSKVYPATSPTSLTPSKDVYTDPNVHYRTEFRGFDGVAGRVKNAAPGGELYAKVTVDSLVTLDSGVAGTDTTTAAQVGQTPAVDVTVTRAGGAGDAFRLYRDGIQVSDDLDPATMIDGTAWTYRDHTTPPNRPHTLRLAPVVNGHAAADNSAGDHVDVTVPVDMIWLGDPLTGDWLPVGGSDISWTRPEDSTEHVVNRSGLLSAVTGAKYPTGTLATIRRVRGKQLPMGVVNGTLIGSDLGDGQAFIDLFTAWQDRAESNPGYVYRLVWKDQNVPVTIGNVELAHTTESDPELDPIAAITFTYWTA